MRRTSQRRDGYRLVYEPDHPMASRKGYVYEHRLVAAQKIGRPLTRDELVHHVNGDPRDNRPENLEIVTKRWHQLHHLGTSGMSDADILALVNQGWSYRRITQLGVSEHRIRRVRREAGL